MVPKEYRARVPDRGRHGRGQAPPLRVRLADVVRVGGDAPSADPGERFPWRRLSEAGVGHFAVADPAPDGECLRQGDAGPPVEVLQSMLALYGYEVGITGVFDTATKIVVSAFQLHFRQRMIDGQADAETTELLRVLLSGLEL